MPVTIDRYLWSITMGKFLELTPEPFSDFIEDMEVKDIFRLSVRQTLLSVCWNCIVVNN